MKSQSRMPVIGHQSLDPPLVAGSPTCIDGNKEGKAPLFTGKFWVACVCFQRKEATGTAGGGEGVRKHSTLLKTHF